MAVDLTVYPYFDTTDDEVAKGYVRVVGAGNYYIQGRDISVIQGLIHEHERRVSSTIYTNGSVLEGCQLVVRTADLTAILTPGLVYYNGYVVAVDETTLTITASGKEIVGLDITESIVDSDDDSTLKGQYPGSIAYGSPGFPRLKLEATASVTLTSAATLPLLKLYELIDGSPKTLFETPYMSNLYNILARRTFDESGSYVVSGLNLYNGTATATTIEIFVGAGKAYIEGYELIVPSNLDYTVDRALDTSSIEGEVQSYVDSSTTTVFTLYNQPANEVTQVAATVQISASITKGIDGGEDDLRPYQPAGQSASTTISIISIIGGDGAYSAGVSYNLSANHVDWVVGQPQPLQGATYACIWTYRKIMVETSDYTVTNDPDTAGGTCYVTLTGTGDMPVDSTLIEFDYTYLLYRHDVIYIDRYGDVHVQKGIPNTKNNAKPPLINDARALILGYAIIAPLATEAYFISKPVRAITMKQLNTLIDYIELLAYNQAVENLDNEAMAGEPATTLRGILTDGLLGYTKVDLGHTAFNTAFDFDTNTMTNLQLYSGHNLVVNTSNTTATINSHILTLPYDEITLVEQQQGDAVQLINPYSNFNIGGILELTPNTDIWTDTVSVITGEAEHVDISVGQLRRWWSPHMSKPEYAAAALADKAKLEALGVDVGSISPSQGRGTVTYEINNELSRIKTDSQTIAAQWVRGNTVALYGYNFTPLSDLLTLYVDNHELALVAASPAYEGSVTGTLTSDADGIVKGTFTIPNEFYECGTLKVRLTNANNEAVATYTAKGMTTYDYYSTIEGTVTVTWTDPLAQSFGFDDDDYFITGIGVYFAVKDATDPVEIELRNMENGFPGTRVLTKKLIDAADISASGSLDGGTIETKITFDDPVFCEKGAQYCFVVKTDSDTASLWTATLGGTDLITENRILKNPYGVGVMFSSSNASSWNAHQSTDLKFNIYGASFLDSAAVTVEYDPFTATLTTTYDTGTSTVTYTGYSRICLLADPIILAGTSIDWEYGVTDSASSTYTWNPLEPYVDIELEDSLVKYLKVRATIAGTEHVSPIINKSQTGFVGLLTTQYATYITRNVQMPDTYDSVVQYLDVYLPDTATCSFSMSYASDTSGSTWTSAVATSSSSVAIGNDYYRWTLEPGVTASYTAFRARVDIETDHPLHRVIAKRFMNIAKVAI